MREQEHIDAVTAALLSVGADRESAAHLEFGDVLRVYPELAAGWAAVRSGGDPARARELAGALVGRAGSSGSLRDALDGWLRERAAHVNSVSGSVRILGSSVQARDVHGGIHVQQVQAPPPAPPVPRQIPPVSPHFVGRDTDLAELRECRSTHPGSAPQLIVVSGPAGIGKSALVCRWMGGIADEFPGGQLYADLGGYSPSGPMEPGDVLDGFLRALGASEVPAQTAEKAALWRTFTADLRVAVVLDNAFTAAQVRPLVPSGPGSLVVVTSRKQLTGLVVDGAYLHQVSALEPQAAMELLHRGGGGQRVVREPDAARTILALCAYVPLAVCLAAARLAARPRQSVSVMADSLARGRGPLEELRVEGEAAIGAALDESYRSLPGDVAAVYRCLGTLPVKRFDQDMVAAVSQVSLLDADRLLDALVETNLLEELQPGVFRFHDLVAAHARQRGEDEGTATARTRMRRFVDWCLYTATAAEAILSPSHRTLPRWYDFEPTEPVPFGDDAGQALAWLAAHRETLTAAVRHCAEAGWDAACWQLVDASWPLFLRLRPAEWWIEAHQLGLVAARRVGDRRAVSRLLTSGGNGLRNAGRHEEAAEWYEQALRLAVEDGDLREQAQALNGLGVAGMRAGRLEQAEGFLHRALELREAIGYRRGVALTRLVLGEVALERGHHGEAVRQLALAREGLLAVSDPYDAARALALLGHATSLGGDTRRGEERLVHALGELERTGSPHWQARTAEMLGQAAERRGDEPAAREWYERAAAVFRGLSPRDARRVDSRLRVL
ncbi:tetratricopeptide repeat protein [Streptomyces specialis]|uniref:tetratricopeptide repeat protein n=1 Tax=Streptomyces specialis TaxID=498367 RepID=UPI000ACD6D43|nr:tetratricopeptide repeat protein [Streptomyces specialis]